MGENYGHVDKIISMVRALDERADIYLVVQNPITLRRLAPDINATLLAAPYAKIAKPPGAEGPAASYPDALRRCGWHAPQTLAALIESWRNLFELIGPNVIVAQSAPTALLAARGGPWKTALLGYGYDAPPRASPMPPLRWWHAGEAERAATIEARVLADVNAALAHLELPCLSQFCDFMDVDKFLLASFPELDHYGDRSRWEPDHAPYLGQLIQTSIGEELDWRDGALQRIFVYLRPTQPGFAQAEAVFSAPSPDWDVIFASPGIAPETATALRRADVRVIDGPVRLDRLLPDCSLGIHHASNGTANALLAGGVPQLGLPTHVEQLMCVRALADAGLGAGLGGHFDASALRRAIERILSKPEYTATAKSTAERIAARHCQALEQELAITLLALAEDRAALN